jgi:hypothetical protein
MVEEKSGLDRAPNKRTDMLISNILVDTLERLISQIAQTWRKLQAQRRIGGHSAAPLLIKVLQPAMESLRMEY